MQEVSRFHRFTTNFEQKLYEIKQKKTIDHIVFLCIGTDRITGDSFGPFVGYRLEERLKNNFYPEIKIIGTLEHTVSAKNIQNTLKKIEQEIPNPCIVAIDAALSCKENVGKIVVTEGAMQLGKSLRKEGMQVGDISIKGVVAKDYKIPSSNLKILQNTPLHMVVEMAETVANGIYHVIQYQ